MPTALIFHSKLGPNPPPDELDVLDEAKYFRDGLATLGYEVHQFDFENDLDRNIDQINLMQADFVVNLVETINADGRLIHIAPAFFEHHAIPFTGCPSEAIYVTSNKLLSKKIMQLAGIKTPAFSINPDELKSRFSGQQFLLKSLWEHASFGMDEHNPVFIGNAEIIAESLTEKNKQHNTYFAEEYIEGREFNVSVIAGKNGPMVLPIAEIKFINYPDAKPKIVGYRAKWDEASFEYKNTVRHFVDETAEPDLCGRIRKICLQCWKEFSLKGYVRVDFRMDVNGQLYVLEINANPCISADSGFVAAATVQGLSQAEIVNLIINDLSGSNEK
ncbi:MAG: ATP-grasp domain-containing protein [Bacteroidales bacterium]|nr:ATP-grasp domain-containing protein [Bacteroidales bacterium]